MCQGLKGRVYKIIKNGGHFYFYWVLDKLQEAEQAEVYTELKGRLPLFTNTESDPNQVITHPSGTQKQEVYDSLSPAMRSQIGIARP